MSALTILSEVVVYVGIAVHDAAFKGLCKRDEDYIRGMAEPDSHISTFRPVFRHGRIVGYGVPIIIADPSDDFREITEAQLYEAIARARDTVERIARKVRPPFQPKLYAPEFIPPPKRP